MLEYRCTTFPLRHPVIKFMSLFQAILLGIVQGLTEFLPVSSSGHLVLANYYMGWGKQLPLYVDIATNTGTLFAVLIVLRRDVWQALSGFFRGLRSHKARQQEGWRMALLVILGSIPTAMIGLGLKPIFETLNQPLYVSFALMVTGIILWFTPKSGPKNSAQQLSWLDATLGGIAQGLAVIPGISRSGSTISAMLWRGASPDLAPKFSFLMYLVVSFGVALLGINEVREHGLELAPLMGMTVASFITGYLALLWLFAILRRGQFRWFAPYLWFVAIVTLIRLGIEA